MMSPANFKKEVWRYFRLHKRDFPWRRTNNPYRVLVSEFMLQQTQVERVAPKYLVFVKQFPDFAALARASVADVLRAWQGLGYNRRALALKKCAEAVVKEYRGTLPPDFEKLDALPGIGQSTAGAVCAFAFNMPVVFIETNIRRTYINFFFKNRKKVSDDEILPFMQKTVDQSHAREWYWALMDYGSMLGDKEKENPNTRSAHYKKQPRFEGSRRQLRGKITKLLLRGDLLTPAEIAARVNDSQKHIRGALFSLQKDGFVHVVGTHVTIRI